MKATTLKIALAVITTVGSIAVAALTLLGGDEKAEPAPATPSIVLSPSMNQSSVNNNAATVQPSKPSKPERPPIVNNYIIQPRDESLSEEEDEEIIDDTETTPEP